MNGRKMPTGLFQSAMRRQLFAPFLAAAKGEEDEVETCAATQSEQVKKACLVPEKCEPSTSGLSQGKIKKRSQAGGGENSCKLGFARRVSWTRQVVKYRVLAAVHPFEFYAIEESDKDEDFFLSGGYDLLQKVAVSNQLHLEHWRPRTLEKNKMYTTYDDRTGFWDRCRYLYLDEETGKAVVYYFDYYMEVEQVSAKRLREIPEVFALHPVVPTYKCHLYDIIPTDGSHDWDMESKEIFVRELMKKNKSVWLGLQMSFDQKPVAPGADMLVSIGLVLFEDTKDAWQGISANWRMVKTGKARAIGVGGTHFSNLYFKDSEPLFSLHEAPEITLPKWMLQPFPYEAGARLPQVKIVSVRGLDCIYVTLGIKHRDLRAMEHYMESKMNPSQRLSREQLKFGTPVLCMERLTEESGENFIRRSRGVLIKLFENDEVSVLQVDTGMMIRVPVDNLYVMPPRLVKVPSFVHRVHLNNIRPKSSSTEHMLRWFSDTTANLVLFFESFAKNLDPAWIAFRANPTSNHDIIALRELHQSLIYYCAQRKWTIGNTEKHHHLSLHKMPLVESHFYSFGVDLKAVCSGTGSANAGELWKFLSLSVLIAETEKFSAELIDKEQVDKREYYKKIVGGD